MCVLVCMCVLVKKRVVTAAYIPVLFVCVVPYAHLCLDE